MPPDPLGKNQLFSGRTNGRTDISFSSLPDGKSASRKNGCMSSKTCEGLFNTGKPATLGWHNDPTESVWNLELNLYCCGIIIR